MAIGPAVMLVWIVFGGYYVNAGEPWEALEAWEVFRGPRKDACETKHNYRMCVLPHLVLSNTHARILLLLLALPPAPTQTTCPRCSSGCRAPR